MGKAPFAKLGIAWFFLTLSTTSATDLDFIAGSGNIAGRGANSRQDTSGVGGDTDKVWTPFTPYDSNLNLGIRLLKTYPENFPAGQLGAELSYFTASVQLPADRIVERWAFSNLTSQSSKL